MTGALHCVAPCLLCLLRYDQLSMLQWDADLQCLEVGDWLQALHRQHVIMHDWQCSYTTTLAAVYLSVEPCPRFPSAVSSRCLMAMCTSMANSVMMSAEPIHS